MEPKSHWFNKGTMASSLGISVQAFDKWKVEPIARIGRESFYDARAVLDNRLAAQMKKQQAQDASQTDDPMVEAKLTLERLRLTAAQAEGQELKNDVSKRKSVPTSFAIFVLSRLASEISSILDTLPLTLKRKHPELDARQIESVERELSKVRNRAAQLDSRLPSLLEEFIETVAD